MDTHNRERLATDTRPEPPSNLAALIFGQLAKRAATVVEHYHSDLYHDSTWLGEHVEEIVKGAGFYWGVDDFGTAIGYEHDLVRAARKTVYYIGVIRERDTWYVVFSELAQPTKERA